MKLVKSKIVKIEKVEVKNTKFYDIEVEDNHNYLAHELLCHNSATPYREDGEDMRIQASLGEIVYQIERRKLIDEGFLSDASVHYISLTNHTNDKFTEYHDIYEQYITFNDERNQKIVDIVKANRNKKILILVSIIEHGNEIQKLLEISDINDSKFLHGKIKDRDLALDDSLIIASTIWDEGVDLPSFEVLILAAGGASGIKLTQRIGRVLRPKKGKHADIYDFIDKSRYLSRHYAKRRRILEEEFAIEED